jgi:hypothetical protein
MSVSESPGPTDWIKSSVILRWPEEGSVARGHSDTGSSPKGPVVLICFGPTASFLKHVYAFKEAKRWEEVEKDPFVLLDMVFESWYETLDDSAWTVNSLAQRIEKVSRPTDPQLGKHSDPGV